MSLFDVQREGRRWEIQVTATGRAVWALERFAITAPLVLAGMAIFFLPDYFGRYAEAEPVEGLFWGTVVIIALFISGLLALLRLMRKERWIIDAGAGELVYETAGLFGRVDTGAVDLRDLVRVELTTAPPPTRSELEIELREGHCETICHSRWRPGEIAAVADSLAAFLEEEGREVDFVRPPSGGRVGDQE